MRALCCCVDIMYTVRHATIWAKPGYTLMSSVYVGIMPTACLHAWDSPLNAGQTLHCIFPLPASQPTNKQTPHTIIGVQLGDPELKFAWYKAIRCLCYATNIVHIYATKVASCKSTFRQTHWFASGLACSLYLTIFNVLISLKKLLERFKTNTKSNKLVQLFIIRLISLRWYFKWNSYIEEFLVFCYPMSS